MAVDAHHTYNVFGFSFEIYNEHVVIECVELKMMTVCERAVRKHVVMPAGFLDSALFRKFAYRLANGSDDGCELLPAVFAFERQCGAPEMGEALTSQLTVLPLRR